MSLSSPPEIEFPSQTVVEDWEVSLMQRYRSRDLEQSPKDRSRMETLKVIAIRRYKERRHVEHEYLIAEVLDPDLNQLRYLQIERAAEDPLRTQDATERSSRHTISTLSSQSSLGVFKKLPARDYVSTMAGWPTTSDICIDKLDCRQTQMILLDLAIVAKVVHDHSDKYQLFKRQCFWYSDVIVGVLQENFPRIQVATRDSSLVADHAQGAEMEILDNLSGTYKRVPIYNRRMDLIREIHGLFVTYNFQTRSWVNLLNTGIFLLANHYHRSRKPQRGS
jgi:hypothetical protein